MRGKNYIHGKCYFQTALQSKYWIPVRIRKQNKLKRLVERYQREIDVTLAVMSIGGMFLTGAWGFLVQLAKL